MKPIYMSSHYAHNPILPLTWSSPNRQAVCNDPGFSGTLPTTASYYAFCLVWFLLLFLLCNCRFCYWYNFTTTSIILCADHGWLASVFIMSCDSLCSDQLNSNVHAFAVLHVYMTTLMLGMLCISFWRSHLKLSILLWTENIAKGTTAIMPYFCAHLVYSCDGGRSTIRAFHQCKKSCFVPFDDSPTAED